MPRLFGGRHFRKRIPGRISPLEAGNPSRAPARSWGRPLEAAGCLRACCGPLPPSMLWLAAMLSLGLSSVRPLRGVGTQKPSGRRRAGNALGKPPR